MLAFAILMLTVAGWAITYVGIQAVPTLEAKATLHKIKQPFALTMPLAWFIFCVHYTRAYRLRLRRVRRASLQTWTRVGRAQLASIRISRARRG